MNIVMAITFIIAYRGTTATAATAAFNLDGGAAFGNTTIHLRLLVVIAADANQADNSTAANSVARTRQEQHCGGKQEKRSYMSNVRSDSVHVLSSWSGRSIAALIPMKSDTKILLEESGKYP